MPRFRIFHRLILRPFFREPLRTSLVIFAVALGVAVVLAIELAGNAAAGSFRSSMETLVGDSDLEVRAVGGVPDSVVARLAQLPFPITIHPRIEDYAVVADTGATLPLIGLDLVGDGSSLVVSDRAPANLEFKNDDLRGTHRGQQYLGQRAPRQEHRRQAAVAGQRSRSGIHGSRPFERFRQRRLRRHGHCHRTT